MCGIAGIIGSLTPAAIEAARMMSRCQAHRGPDAEGFYLSPANNVVFTHRRLAIIDLSEDGRQPMTDPETGNVIAFNGEIYNFREVKQELAGLGAAFHTRSDTEVILKAYRQWGTGCLSRLRGMFALVLRDNRTGRILMARDRTGIKPLYYGQSNRESGGGPLLLFASEVRSLLATGLFERRIDPTSLASCLWNGFVVGDGTIIRGISQMPAGSYAEIDPVSPGVEPVRYWKLPARRQRQSSDVEGVRACLAQTVRQHLIGDVPLGVFLSGGIDSSAIAALAARSGAGTIKTFNVSFDEAKFDESPYARRVADQLGTDHQEFRLTQGIFRAQAADALDSLDQPTFDGINTYFVSRIVRESGIKVALAGTGGDELFGGYRSFAELPRLRRVAGLCRFAPSSLIRAAAALATRIQTGPPGEVPPQTRWGKLSDALTSGGQLLDLYQIAYGLFTRDFLGQLARAPECGSMRSGLSANTAERLADLIRGDSDLAAISKLEMSLFLGERLLRDTDAASMAVSLEARVPFLDHELIEAVCGLDDRIRFEPMGRKQLLRTIGLKGLDPAIFDRPKSGFVLPLDVWCRSTFRDQVNDVFMDEGLCRQVGIDQATLLRLWRSFESGVHGLYWSRVWSVFILMRWCKAHAVSL